VGRRWRGRSHARLAEQGVDVIGIASGKRVDAVRAAGAHHVIDRSAEDVPDGVRVYTGGGGVAAVFDPIGAPTYETSLQLLSPRGCLINYGELSGPRLPSTCTNSFLAPSSSPSTTACVGWKASTNSRASLRMAWPWPRNSPP
jgi:NADPH2:quinone reductase